VIGPVARRSGLSPGDRACRPAIKPVEIRGFDKLNHRKLNHR
jgi:hypothetical protein